MAITKKQIIFAGSKAKRFKYNYEHQKNIANYNIGDLYKNTLCYIKNGREYLYPYTCNHKNEAEYEIYSNILKEKVLKEYGRYLENHVLLIQKLDKDLSKDPFCYKGKGEKEDYYYLLPNADIYIDDDTYEIAVFNPLNLNINGELNTTLDINIGQYVSNIPFIYKKLSEDSINAYDDYEDDCLNFKDCDKEKLNQYFNAPKKWVFKNIDTELNTDVCDIPKKERKNYPFNIDYIQTDNSLKLKNIDFNIKYMKFTDDNLLLEIKHDINVNIDCLDISQVKNSLRVDVNYGCKLNINKVIGNIFKIEERYADIYIQNKPLDKYIKANYKNPFKNKKFFVFGRLKDYNTKDRMKDIIEGVKGIFIEDINKNIVDYIISDIHKSDYYDNPKLVSYIKNNNIKVLTSSNFERIANYFYKEKY